MCLGLLRGRLRGMATDVDAPDIYADGLSVMVGQYGLTLTFMRTVVPPPSPPGQFLPIPEAAQQPVAHVRVSRELAAKIAETLPALLAQPLPVPAAPVAHETSK